MGLETGVSIIAIKVRKINLKVGGFGSRKAKIRSKIR
jgi:hypothetical protein